jgi:hypothetical protein
MSKVESLGFAIFELRSNATLPRYFLVDSVNLSNADICIIILVPYTQGSKGS